MNRPPPSSRVLGAGRPPPTDRSRATQALRRLSQVIQDAAQPIVIEDLDGCVIDANDETVRVFGWSRNELIGQPAEMLIPPEGHAQADKLVARCERKERVRDVDGLRLTKAGGIYPVLITLTLLTDERDEPIGIATLAKERHGQKRGKSEGDIAFQAIASSLNGVVFSDAEGRITYTNPTFIAMFGYGEADAALGQQVGGLFSDPKLKSLTDVERQTPGAPWEPENYLCRRQDGSEFPVEVTCSTITDEAGETVGRMASFIDITERQRAKEALRRALVFSESLTRTAPSIVLVLDAEGRIIQFNPYMEELTGWQESEMQGRDYFDAFVPAHDRQRFRSLFDRTQRGEKTRGEIYRIATKDGRERDIEWYVAKLTGTYGQLIGLLYTGLDVTDRQILQRRILEVAEEEQRRIGQELHDGTQQQLIGLGLLTERITGALEKLGQTEGTIEFADHVRRLYERATQVHKGLNDAARGVEQLARGLIPVEVEAGGLMSSLSELARGLNRSKRMVCAFACDGSVELTDSVVATHLYRIAQEAVNNALKHSGGNRLDISLSEPDGRVTLRILDNGRGFDEQDATCGVGLQIMSYRAALINATLRIERANDSGTEVVCTVGQRKKTSHVRENRRS